MEHRGQGLHFSHLRTKNFRRLKDLDLPLRPLTVLIGANGSGKTSILDILSLLARSARGELSSVITDLSGISALLTYGATGDLCFTMQQQVAEQCPLEYELRLTPQGLGYVIGKEMLSQDRGRPQRFKHLESHGSNVKYFETQQNKLVPPNWEFNQQETALSQVPKMFREPEEFRQQLASSVLYHVLDVEGRAPVRLPQPMRPASLPGPNGEDLVSCLFSLQQTDRGRFEIIEDTLRAAFPAFERLEFPPVAAGTLALTWRDGNFDKPLYMHQLSEGMLRFLWLVTLLQSHGLTAMTLLDEPEVSLHPDLLRLLASLLREASQRTQIVVATHSDRLIRFLKPSEVVVMDADEDGFTAARWADTLNLDEWLSDYCLDDLWMAGRLGAR